MRRQRVSSSTVSEIGYDDDRQVLEVLFRNGHAYQYFDVPRRTYDELVGAGSVGRYLNANIKGSFRYARV